jgi:BASS family bile acid:Na+ symporter
MVTIVPALVGVFINSKFTDLAHKIKPVLKYLLPILLMLIFGVKFLAPHDKGGIHLSNEELWSLGFWVLLLNFAGMILGYLLGALFKINIQNKVTIMVEVGLQNTALALLIAGNILKNADMQKPAMVYAMITFFSTLIFAWLIKTTSLKFFDKSKSA